MLLLMMMMMMMMTTMSIIIIIIIIYRNLAQDCTNSIFGHFDKTDRRISNTSAQWISFSSVH